MPDYMIMLGVLGLTAITTAYYFSRDIIEEEKQNDTVVDVYTDKHILEKGTEHPKMWLYYDQSDVNSRYWSDFGARSSRVLNSPFLNLCYESIVMKNGKNYTVNIIAGLSDLAILLGGWHELPKPLQNPISPVGEAELNYIRSTVLRRFGGLWVNPSTTFLHELPEMKEKVVFFGSDKDESYSDENGTTVPGVDIMFSPSKDHPVFVELEELALHRIERREGGKQFRKDIKWDLMGVMEKHQDMIEYNPSAEFARKSNGRRIQLEDLLGSNNIPIPSCAIYVPIDWEELQKRRNFGWFLRMSETQILESEIFLSKIFIAST